MRTALLDIMLGNGLNGVNSDCDILQAGNTASRPEVIMRFFCSYTEFSCKNMGVRVGPCGIRWRSPSLLSSDPAPRDHHLQHLGNYIPRAHAPASETSHVLGSLVCRRIQDNLDGHPTQNAAVMLIATIVFHEKLGNVVVGLPVLSLKPYPNIGNEPVLLCFLL